MGKAKRIGLVFLRRAPIYVAAKVVLALFVLVSAATIITTPTTYQASIGGAISVTNNLKAMDKGFSKAASALSAAGTACGANSINFTGTAGVANTAITAGNFIYVVQVNTTGSTAANTCFRVNLIITPDGGSQLNQTVYIGTGPSAPPADQTIDCKFDIGASLPNSPYSFKVKVQ